MQGIHNHSSTINAKGQFCIKLWFYTITIFFLPLDFSLTGTDRKAVVQTADMSEDMKQDAVDLASQALSKYKIEKVRNDYYGRVQNFLFIRCVPML